MKFKLDINLDDETELKGFMSKHGIKESKDLAKEFGFGGRKAVRAVNGLRSYANHKSTAMNYRRDGYIDAALHHERICDAVYKRDIQPLIECW